MNLETITDDNEDISAFSVDEDHSTKVKLVDLIYEEDEKDIKDLE